MKRLLAAAMVMAAVGAGTYAIVNDDAAQPASVMPYPGTTTPLPVPEAEVDAPGESPARIPTVEPPLPLEGGDCDELTRLLVRTSGEGPPRVVCFPE